MQNKNKIQNYKIGSSDLFQAMIFIAEIGNPPAEQKSNIGCSIKWSNSTG
nr:hypothetical protein [Wolbachia endosymbiont of Atemnus politus]